MKTVKKLIAALLCAMLIIGSGVMAVSVGAANDTALIYLRGSTDLYKFNDDGTYYEMFDDGEYVKDIIENAIPLLPGALLGDVEPYSQAILEAVTPAWDAFRPNIEDGSVPEDTHVINKWTYESVAYDAAHYNYFEYCMDPRLSPFEAAADLHEFVEAVKAETGKTKIHLYARCLGPVLAMTYLYLYEAPTNFENVEGVMLSFSTHNGMTLTDAVFTGNVNITETAFTNWLSGFDFEEDVGYEVNSLINLILTEIANTAGLKATPEVLNKLYEKFRDPLFKPLLKNYYALCLMNLACVNEDFDDMMAYLFSDEGDDEKYAYAIGELTRYHNEIYPEINSMLHTIKDQGKTMIIMADYNGQQYPLNEEAEYIGDFQVGLKSMSLGATGAKIGETLSDEYIADRIEKGFGKYISPDRKVDASTCEFPDNTFFVANFDHQWPGKYAGIETNMLEAEAFDIYSDPNLPQFLYWDFETENLVPLASVLPEEEPDAPDAPENPTEEEESLWDLIYNFIKRILDKIFRNFR